MTIVPWWDLEPSGKRSQAIVSVSDSTLVTVNYRGNFIRDTGDFCLY